MLKQLQKKERDRRIPFGEAGMILCAYSLGMKQLVQINTTYQRTTKGTTSKYPQYAKRPHALVDHYKKKRLQNPRLFPGWPLHGIECGQKQFTKENTQAHNECIPSRVLAHQARFLHRQVTALRRRRRALLDDTYDGGQAFFLDETDREQYFKVERAQHYRELGEQQMHKDLGEVVSKGHKFRIKANQYRNPKMTRVERIEHMGVDAPLDVDQIVILVNVSSYYHNGKSLAKFKPTKSNTLPTIHNALAFYLQTCTINLNQLLAPMVDAAKRDTLKVRPQDRNRAHALTLTPDPLDIYAHDGPWASRLSISAAEHNQQRAHDRAIGHRRHTHKVIKDVLQQTQKQLDKHLPAQPFDLARTIPLAPVESKATAKQTKKRWKEQNQNIPPYDQQ